MRRTKHNRRRATFVRGDAANIVTTPVAAPPPDPILDALTPRRRPVPDRATLAAMIAEADVRHPIDRPHPTGRCHDCTRKITGERIYCGPCLARRA